MKITATSAVGLVSINGGTPAQSVEETVPSGSSVTLTYIHGSDMSKGFYQWPGLPLDVYPFDTNVTFTATADVTVSPQMANVRYVATDGSDETGEGTREKPYATIQYALVQSDNFDEIRVKQGLYVGCITNKSTCKLVKNLSFKGSYNDTWVQDYRNSRSIIKSPKTTLSCVVMENVQTNRFDGFDVTGGYYGFHMGGESFNGTPRKVFGPYTHHMFTHMIVTNNASSGLYHNVNAVNPVADDGDYGFAVASSLIAFNGGSGVWVKNDQDTTSHCHFYNCTVVSNKSHGIYGYGNYNNYLNNSIVAFNGTSSGSDLYAGAKMFLANMCAFGGTSGALGGSAGSYVSDETYLGVNPLFGGMFRLSSASLCSKRGIDLSAHSLLPVGTDVYGEPWNGEYDMGCFKSEHPLVSITKYAEVWVSTDGDDDNPGNSADTPLRTLARANLVLASGGTVHVGAGVFAEGFSLYGSGATFLGAGRDKTVININGGAGITVGGHDARVEGITIDGASYGFKLTDVGGYAVTNVTVRDCTVRNCSTGWYIQQDNLNNGIFTNSVTQCVFSNCTTYALHWQGIHSGSFRRGNLLADRSLFVRNKQAYYSDCQPPTGGKNEHAFVNCTVISNTAAGFSTWTNLRLDLYNCIVVDNGTKNAGSNLGSPIHINNSLVNAMISASGGCTATRSDTNFPGFAALKLNMRPGREWRLTTASPARKFGDRSLAGSVIAGDLDGFPAPATNWDTGCYFFTGSDGFILLIR